VAIEQRNDNDWIATCGTATGQAPQRTNVPDWFATFRPTSHNPSQQGLRTAWDISDGTNTVSGETRCSDTQGTPNMPGNPSETAGGSCWCRMTSPTTGRWVNLGQITGQNFINSCRTTCANSCASHMHTLNPPTLRNRVMGLN